MISAEEEQLLRRYASGAITWSLLRTLGFDNYRRVLAGLGELGLRPPVASADGPNWEARQRARAVIRDALRSRA